ncbi:unnamed protein product [Schistocephalus solidus]|uniref:Translin-associated factor X-interacting protein 1 n=1 Tax=Schistocephalus solidus TaxID=70667 RepID=A0A183SET2_SCHSO|nr:unnamed protein product [Schistocephalus solidus]
MAFMAHLLHGIRVRGGSGRTSHLRPLPSPVFLTLTRHRAQVTVPAPPCVEHTVDLVEIDGRTVGDIAPHAHDQQTAKFIRNICNMEKLKSDMATLEELRRTEADARKLGVITSNQLQMQLSDMRHSFQESMRAKESHDDPVRLKIALQKAKEAHTFLLTKLTKMETDYVDVVPRKQFEEVSEKLKTMGEDLEVLTKHCKTLQSSLEDQTKVLEETIEQKNEVETLYSELKRSSTPRPAWREAVCNLPGGKKYWRQLASVKSSRERLYVLIREFLNESDGENRSSRGTDSTVPALLRSSEPVLQRTLPLRDLLLLVEDIWTKRKTQLAEFLDKCALTDESEQPSLPSFDEFLANYFQANFGLSALRKEWAYALYNSADFYSECEELVQLRKIIDNQMDEAYHWYLDSLIRRAFNKLKQLAHATAIASTVPDDAKAETPGGAKTVPLSKRKASRELSILTPENLQTCLSRLLQCDAKQVSVLELVHCAFTDHRSVPDEEGTNETVVAISPNATVAVENLFAKASPT